MDEVDCLAIYQCVIRESKALDTFCAQTCAFQASTYRADQGIKHRCGTRTSERGQLFPNTTMCTSMRTALYQHPRGLSTVTHPRTRRTQQGRLPSQPPLSTLNSQLEPHIVPPTEWLLTTTSNRHVAIIVHRDILR